jgi:hypothetical protein
MSKKPILVVERSRKDIENQVNVTSTSLSDHVFWTPPYSQKTPPEFKVFLNIIPKKYYSQNSCLEMITAYQKV